MVWVVLDRHVILLRSSSHLSSTYTSFSFLCLPLGSLRKASAVCGGVLSVRIRHLQSKHDFRAGFWRFVTKNLDFCCNFFDVLCHLRWWWYRFSIPTHSGRDLSLITMTIQRRTLITRCKERNAAMSPCILGHNNHKATSYPKI